MDSRLISLEQADEWRDALETVPHCYWHTWQANDAIHRGTGQPTFLFFHQDRTTGSRALLPFSEREWRESLDVYSPAGFAGFVADGPTPHAAGSWRAMAEARDYVCGYFALHPLTCPPALHGAAARANELFVLDLRQGPETLLARFDADTRRRLARQQSELSVMTDRDALGAFVLEHYESFMHGVGASPRAIWPRKMLEAVCADSGVHFFGATDESGVCAATLFGVTPFCAEYLISVRLRTGQGMNSALMWAAIRRFAELEVAWLNLGGGVTEGDSIARSKRRFGPASVPMLVSKEIYRPQAYEALMRQAGLSFDEPGAFFPGYRASKT